MRQTAKKRIKDIVNEIKSKFPYSRMKELIESLDIHLKIVSPSYPLLHNEFACFVRTPEKQTIYLSEDCPDEIKEYTLAHEIGHAVLHDVELAHFQLLYKTGKIEEEADYFASLILNLKITLEDGYTIEDYSKLLGVKESVIQYLID